ncbi:MAG: type II toxin-antitoxin system HicB family antitoxin [Thermomicrobiales bacterium]|nr:MAG: type II toxin-antitoxin system HicB family antitoxin [Thermomicrobiales bacterium]
MATMVTLDEALARDYRFDVIADPDGGFVIRFPDLPGCMTQVERIEDVGAAAEEIRTLWLETAAEAGQDLPGPTFQEEFSGKFNVRIPRSLHRDLVHHAAEEGVSLNQLVVSLLSDRSRWSDRNPKARSTPRLSKVG